ncbi:hypothetical protein NW752_000084 [Fusarium irregulare]|uniref:Uncharacterized protein n=1 Tax=Fusarium irregulare TaxID=2494466 RepID=A0A9W8PYU7_9HYPO|nr:hypothetical protein NW766_001753 [Fusarium irregulare]KAJ4027839.1 hypothetical protein NW752_000084 [Fusarium irregulare]
MTTAVAEGLLGASLKAFAKGAGEGAASEICSALIGSLFGGGDDASAEADSKILAKLDEILSSLNQVHDSLNRIEQAVAEVAAEVDASVIQLQISIITSAYDSYFDCMNGIAAAVKATNPTSLSEYRERLVEESIKVKNAIPDSLNIIHGFIIDQKYPAKLAAASLGPAVDIVDFYSKVKLPLLKIAMVEIKAIHLLRFAGAANQDKRVDFPDAPAAIQRALSHIDLQDQALTTAIGPEIYGLVSTMLTRYPNPAPACINPIAKRGLTFGKPNDDSTWYGGETTQLWYILPPSDGPIVTDGSRVNGFRLRHVDTCQFISIEAKTLDSVVQFITYRLGAVTTFNDAAIWNFHLTLNRDLVIQSQAYPDTFLGASSISYSIDPYVHRVYMNHDYKNPDMGTQFFICNMYQGSVNDFWPRNITEMQDGEYLIPGAYLEDPSKMYRLTFKDDKFGVWDVKNNSWKWDSGVVVDTSCEPTLVFSGTGVLTLSEKYKVITGEMLLSELAFGTSDRHTLKTWGPGPSTTDGAAYILRVSPEGALEITTGDPQHPSWSSETQA